jgi:sulfite dehydrogenase (cytochrome) subunit A
VKALNEINVLNEKFKGFWMEKAYRIPTNPGVQETPAELAKETVPISTMTCRSIFVNPQDGQQFKAGAATEVEGLAWDSGKGITKVEVSVDAGATWTDAKLDKDLGKYSWRRFRYSWTPAAGKHTLMARASNAAGESQQRAQWNRSGYARNVIEAVTVNAV